MVLSVNGVSKHLNSRLVLDHVSFTVDKGQIVGFIGPNGAGKTTAIKVILGLLSPETGSVTISGHNIANDHEAALSSVGAIIESPELYSYLSGFENLMQFARIYGIGKERVLECAGLVGLENRINDKVSRYSLGMRQRLGVAQAIMHDPGLLILDEPTNGLDPDGIKDLRDTLRRLAFENGTAILVSSHLLSELEHICTDVCVIENGRIISQRSLAQNDQKGNYVKVFAAVGDPDTALNVLNENGFSAVSQAEGGLTFDSRREDIPKAVKALVAAGCDVYGITEKKTTLEDAYFEATSGESANGGDFH